LYKLIMIDVIEKDGIVVIAQGIQVALFGLFF
jgi:hypothetical protein